MRVSMVPAIAVLGFLSLSLAPIHTIAQHVYPEWGNYPAKPAAIKIDFLMEACADPGGGERGMVPYFDCQSYVLGVVDSYRLLRNSIAKEKTVCLPENVTTREIVKLIYSTYRQEPFPQNRGAADVILEVLRKKYPCNK